MIRTIVEEKRNETQCNVKANNKEYSVKIIESSNERMIHITQKEDE